LGTSPFRGEAIRAQLWLGLVPPSPARNGQDRTSIFNSLPSLDQTEPERPVALVPGGGRKASALIGAPLELIVAAGADDSE